MTRLLALFALFVVPLPYTAAALVSQQQADARAHLWAMQHYAAVHEAVLPIAAPLDIVRKNLKWGVRLRITPAFGPESAYTLLKGFEKPVIATVTTVTGGSVLTQLEALYVRHRTAAAGKLPALIERSTRELTVDHCPALKDVAQAFEDLRIPASLDGALQMDAVGYELVSEGRSGTLRLSISAPDPAPVVAWAERVRTTVAACAPR
jgi:hypothetical protein